MFSTDEDYLARKARAVRLQNLVWPALNVRGINAYLRRDDEIHYGFSGNKFYKLYYNIQQALAEGKRTLVSFGGAYSNHIHALAAAGHLNNLNTVGIIRGHQPEMLTPTLKDAQRWGMRLFFLDKKSYQNKDLTPILPILKQDHGDYHLIPEGGENLAGVRGCQMLGSSLAEQLPNSNYTVCCATATGSTLAGIIAGSPPETQVIGINVLKGEDKITANVAKWIETLGLNDHGFSHRSFEVITGYHHGGYARVTAELLTFMKRFEQSNSVILEPIYTAKLLWAIEDLAKQGKWSAGDTVVAIHSGGLQGRRGFSMLEELGNTNQNIKDEGIR